MYLVLILSLCSVADSPSPSPAETRIAKPRPLRTFANHPFSKGMTFDQVNAIIHRMALASATTFSGNGFIYATDVVDFEVLLLWDESMRVKSIDRLKLIYTKPGRSDR